MRRLLQLGTLLLLATTILVPISESLDRWDAPGLDNDTEFHLFAIVLFLALVLLLARHLSRAAAQLATVLLAFLTETLAPRRFSAHASRSVFHVPPLASPPTALPLLLTPLRI